MIRPINSPKPDSATISGQIVPHTNPVCKKTDKKPICPSIKNIPDDSPHIASGSNAPVMTSGIV